MDFRHSRHVQFQPIQSASANRSLRGSFDSISHDVNQPLNAAIQTGLGNVFSSTPLAILQPRTAIAWQFESKSVLRAGFGIFSDILPGSIADVVGVNPPYVKSFQGGLLGTVGGTAIAPGVPNSAIDATVAANQTFSSGFPQGQLSCASAQANPATCLPPVAITAVPNGELHAPYFMEWSLGLEHQFGTTGSIHAQYVGTRAVNQPYLTQVNGYQTVCEGCFAPFPYAQSTDPRFGAVTQFSTGANSHYNGLQLMAMKRMGHGLMGQINYTWSRCMDTVSNGGFLQFSAGGILSPLPGDLARDYGPCDYDIRQQSQRAICLSISGQSPRTASRLRTEWLVGVGNRLLAQRDSVLRPEHALFSKWKWHRERQWAAIRERCSRRTALQTQFHSRRHTTGHGSVAQSRCVCLDRGPEHRCMLRRRQPQELPIREPRSQRAARSRFRVE